MNYQNSVKDQLSNYKNDVLNIEEKGVFKHNGRELYYDHILPKKNRILNILEPYRESFYNSNYSNIKYHRYYHHLNSSQAMCINLFYPLIAENRLDLIFKLLNLPEMESLNAEFEFESDLESTYGRKTNFDFFMSSMESSRIYFELKFTEQEFGSAKNDSSHANKFQNTYLPLLLENPFIKDEFKSLDNFLGNYQVMRNLVHLGESDYVVFLYPKENHDIHKAAKRAHEEILTDKGKERFKLVTLADAVEYITDHISGDRAKKHYDEFERKYLI